MGKYFREVRRIGVKQKKLKEIIDWNITYKQNIIVGGLKLNTVAKRLMFLSVYRQLFSFVTQRKRKKISNEESKCTRKLL